MYYSPHTHLAISRERHEDMLREAHKRQLARLVQDDRPSLLSRIRSLIGQRSVTQQQPAARPV
jgi:3-phenylpropionate/cinnamic acid dioxygenase small subunit